MPIGGPPRSNIGDAVIGNRIAAQLFGAVSPPVEIGRFEVIEKVGSGGMGIVYRARDHRLGRDVALKLLHSGMGEGELEGVRLSREARALAQLSHPNVVQLFEVGEHEGRLFLAMEYVPGLSLDRWQSRTSHDWQKIVSIYIEAGQGLAAAHATGLVHRDFKPENCIVDDDGRARVLDFGLVRYSHSELEVTHEERAQREGRDIHSSRDEGGAPVTRTGSILGTPAYMAPEQLRGEPVDARADQFSFCVALYEALFGERPGREESPEISEEGRSTVPTRVRRIPKRVRRAIARGLSEVPEQRWPTMQLLLEELGRGAQPKRRRWIGTLMVSGALTAVAYGRWHSEQQICAGAREHLAGVWDAARRDDIARAIAEVTQPYTMNAWTRVERRLNAYGDAWVRTHGEVCEATSIRGERSDDELNRRMACLDRAKHQLVAVVGVLSTADVDVMENIHAVVDELRPPGHCAEFDVSQIRDEPPPPDRASSVSEARSLLVEAGAERIAGRYARAEEGLRQARSHASGVEYEPLQMEIALEAGQLLRAQGHYAESEAELRHALRLASKGRRYSTMQEVANALMLVVAVDQTRIEHGLRYREFAEGDGDDALAQAAFHHNHASVLHTKGDVEAALVEVERALQLREGLLGASHASTLDSKQLLAKILLSLGDYSRSEAVARELLASFELVLGVEHPRISIICSTLAGALFNQGQVAAAAEQMRRALTVGEATLGPLHEKVATFRGNYALILQAWGEFEQAEVIQRRALELRIQQLGPEHATVAQSYNNLGMLMIDMKKYESAEVELRRSLTLRERILDPDHIDIATTKGNLADLLLGQGEIKEARALAESMWQRLQRSGVPVEDRASAAFLLAATCWSEDPQRARELAEDAREIYAGAGEAHAEALAKVDEWLADRPLQ